MLSTLEFVILVLATGSAQSLGRQHRPVALAFWWFIIAEYALTRNVGAFTTRVLVATYPVAIASASWAALHSRARTYLGPVFASLSGIAGAYVVTRYDREGLGTAFALLWLGGALVGAAAFFRSDAPSTTRTVLVLLLFGLGCESVVWIGWGRQDDVAHQFSHFVSRCSLVIIVGVQAVEALRVTWRPPWATIADLKLERVREWARTWRRTEIDDGRNSTQAPSSRM